MLNRRILRIKAFKVLYSYAENPDLTLKEALDALDVSCEATRDLYLYMLAVIPALTAEAARRIEDLFLMKSLHYEKKKGDLKGVDVVWINAQYRLLFHSTPDETGIVVNALLFEISKHYE